MSAIAVKNVTDNLMKSDLFLCKSFVYIYSLFPTTPVCAMLGGNHITAQQDFGDISTNLTTSTHVPDTVYT